MRSATIKSHTDAWVEQDGDHANHGGGAKLRVRGSGSGRKRYSFIYFPRPFDQGATISSATLFLYQKGGWGSADATVTVTRVTDPWREGRVNYANQPSVVTGDEGTQAVSGSGSDGREVQVDVTDIFASASAGDPYNGLRVEIDVDDPRSFWSSDAPKERYCPRLVVEWGQEPYPPSNLHPVGGRAVSGIAPTFTWRFSDEAGQFTQQSGSRVQISTSTDFSSPYYDSAPADPFFNTNTRHDWSLLGETTLANNTTYYWRVMVQDDGGFASGWSDVAKFKRVTQGTVTIDNPPVDGVVTDLTPPITFSLSGRTLDRFSAIISRLNSDGSQDILQVENEQVVPSDFSGFNVQEGTLQINETYLLQLWVFDTVNREVMAGDPDFVFAQRQFVYHRDGTPDPPSSLTADSPVDRPVVRLTWARTEEPDYWCVKVDGKEHPKLQRIDPEDVRTGPSLYQMEYWFAKPNVNHTYEVEAVVQSGGVKRHSNGNPTATVATNIKGKWLADPDDGLCLQFLDKTPATLTVGESMTVYNPTGTRQPIMVTDAVRGYEGTVSGTLDEDTRDIIEQLKGRMKEIRYLQFDMNMPVILGTTIFSPDSEQAPLFQGSVDIYQNDEFFFVEGSRR